MGKSAALLGDAGLELGRELGHGAVLGADEGGDFDGELVRLGDGHALEEAGHHCGGEAVAGADGVGNFDCGRLDEGDVAALEDVAAVDAAGEDEQVEVVHLDELLALLFKVGAGEFEEAADDNELFVVYFEDVALAEGGFEDFLRVETLAEVDVEDLEGGVVGGHGVEEAVDGLARNVAALGERAPAYGAGLAGEGGELVGEGDVVPRHAFADFVLGHAVVVERHLDGAGGIRHAGDVELEAFAFEGVDGFLTELVVAHGGDNAAVEAQL